MEIDCMVTQLHDIICLLFSVLVFLLVNFCFLVYDLVCYSQTLVLGDCKFKSIHLCSWADRAKAFPLQPSSSSPSLNAIAFCLLHFHMDCLPPSNQSWLKINKSLLLELQIEYISQVLGVSC